MDGAKNPKIQSIFIKDMAIRTALFTPDGQQVGKPRLLLARSVWDPMLPSAQVIISGRRKYYYSYDVLSGKVHMIHGIQGERGVFEGFEGRP